MGSGRAAARVRAACGIVGPVAFTAAWAISGARQAGYSIRHEHISGLAAPDARDPHIMTAGFLTLGVATIAFGWELQRRLGGSPRAGPGPGLIAGAGASVLLAGILRRDRMANVLPGETEPYRQSLVNDGHDDASIVGQLCSVIGLLALARRFRGDPAWADLRLPTLGVAALTGGLGVIFGSHTARPGNGVVQRVAISTALAGMVATGVRMLRVLRVEALTLVKPAPAS